MSAYEQENLFASAESFDTTGIYGVLTNTGNLRDILARGVVIPSAWRRKNYSDLGDLSPDEVVLVRFPVPIDWLGRVTSEAGHLRPVFLPLKGNALTGAKVVSLLRKERGAVEFEKLEEGDALVAFPGPIPLTVFDAIRFASAEDRTRFEGAPLHGEDALGTETEVGITTTDTILSIPDTKGDSTGATSGASDSIRRLDARAGVLAVLFADGMGGASRHVAIRAMERLRGEGGEAGIVLGGSMLAGGYSWLTDGSVDSADQSSLITSLILERLCAAGNMGGLSEEKFLAELSEAAGELPLPEDRRKLALDRIAAIRQAIDFSGGAGSEDSSQRGPFHALLVYLRAIRQFENEKYSTPDSPEDRIARIFHASRVGWRGMTTGELPVSIRRIIMETAAIAWHRENGTGATFFRLEPMPIDHEGWIVEKAIGRKTMENRVLKLKAFASCWDSSVGLPCPLSELGSGLASKFQVRGLVDVKHKLDPERLRELLSSGYLAEATRASCERAMFPKARKKR